MRKSEEGSLHLCYFCPCWYCTWQPLGLNERKDFRKWIYNRSWITKKMLVKDLPSQKSPQEVVFEIGEAGKLGFSYWAVFEVFRGIFQCNLAILRVKWQNWVKNLPSQKWTKTQRFFRLRNLENSSFKAF